jgi:hypothetical protein
MIYINFPQKTQCLPQLAHMNRRTAAASCETQSERRLRLRASSKSG